MSHLTASAPRTVLVTGAGGGLGRALADGFAAQGHRVVAADIDAAAAEVTAAAARGAGAEAVSIALDVTDRDSTDRGAEFAAQFGGGVIDVLVNNAAIYATITRSAFEEISDAEWDRVLGVNLRGVWQMTRAASPHLSAGSAVVNLASATVLSGSAHWAHYVASKAGVIGLTRVLARELGAREITVNAIAPGFILTEASRGLIPDAETYGLDRASIKRAIEPADIVDAALFLAAGGFVTGQTLVVDGGRQFL